MGEFKCTGPVLYRDAREGRCITATEYFSKVEEKHNRDYLEIFSPMSVLQISIMQKDSAGKASFAKANVKVMECLRLIDKTKVLSETLLTGGFSGGSGAAASDGSEPTFKFGTLAGKTPSEVLAENGADTLNQQRKYLADNLAKFPANQVIIDAIDKALAGGENNDPAPEAVKTAGISPVVKLIAPMYKYFSSDHDASGRTRVYQLGITANLSDAAKPQVTVEIMNGYAFLSDVGNGLRNVDTKTFDQNTRCTYRWNIAWDVWEDFMARLAWDIEECKRSWWAECRQQAYASIPRKESAN